MTKNNLKVVKSTKDQDLEKKEKNKALDAAISQITDNFGKGSVMKLGQQTAMDIESISTGSLSLDLALGIGGLPKGRVIEIYGPESAGKSTLALHAVASAQKAGGVCAYIDTEHALNAPYAKAVGIDIDNMFLSQPDYGEQALDIVDEIVKADVVDLVVVDSVAALTPKAELEGDMEKIIRPAHNVRSMSAQFGAKPLSKLAGHVESQSLKIAEVMKSDKPDPLATQGMNDIKESGQKLLALYNETRKVYAKLPKL